jgi:hypothetical protein
MLSRSGGGATRCSPREIVERLSGRMLEIGKTDRIQKLLDKYGTAEPVTAETVNLQWFGCRVAVVQRNDVLQIRRTTALVQSNISNDRS